MTTQTTATAADIKILEEGLISLGLAIGTVVVIGKAASGNPWAMAAGMALYAVAIVAITLRNRRADAVPAGYGPLLGFGVGGSMGVVALAVALLSAGFLSWPLAITLAMAASTPAMLAAHRLSTLAA